MHPGKYLYVVILFMLTLVGLAAFASLTAEITVGLINDQPSEHEPWIVWAIALGVASLLTSAIDAIRRD